MHNLTDWQKRDQPWTACALGGVAATTGAQRYEVEGVRHTLRASSVGTVPIGSSCRVLEHRWRSHFGRAVASQLAMDHELEAVRLTAAGQAIRERQPHDDPLGAQYRQVLLPAPGRVEWLGWEISRHRPPSDEATTTERPCRRQRPRLRPKRAETPTRVRSSGCSACCTDGTCPTNRIEHRAPWLVFVDGQILTDNGAHPIDEVSHLSPAERRRLELGVPGSRC